MKFGKMILSLALVALLATSASAVVVGTVTDAQDSGGGVDGENDFFAFGGWHEDGALTASDGNVHYGLGHDDGAPNSNLGAGLSWNVLKADYETAIGHALAAGNVIRLSMWFANNPDDPMLNEDTWTESLKFEFRDNSGAEPQPDGSTDEGGLMFPSNCDLGTGVCSDPGQINGTPGDWNLVAGDYVINNPVAGDATIEVVAPVLFVGDYTGAEAQDGSFYLDNLMVEIFEDQAAADASPASASNPHPGGIVPEPTSAVLFLLGACGLGLTRKRS